MNVPTVSPELRALLRRVKLGRCLDTLPSAWPSPRPGAWGMPSSWSSCSPTR
jgi:hypothetical protein